MQSMGSVGDANDNAMRESLFGDARVRAARPAAVPNGGRGAARSLQLHRGLLQHPPAPLGARLSFAGQLREAPSCGLRRTWCVGPVAPPREPSAGLRDRVAPIARPCWPAGGLPRFACPPSFGGRETRHPNEGPVPPPLSARERKTTSDTINPKPTVRESEAGPRSNRRVRANQRWSARRLSANMLLIQRASQP